MIRGILPALITPMDDDGTAVNYASLTRLVEQQIQRGVSGFFVCGGSGEGLLLSPDERRRVLAAVIEAASGRARVIAHIGAVDTATAVRLAGEAASVGADAISAVPPIYFRVDDDALVEHYRMIGEAAGETPLYPYQIPSATGVDINARIVERLLAIPSLAGIKYSSYNLFDMRNIIELGQGRLSVLSGFDEVCLAALSMGAHGAIGSTYNVMPATFSALYQAMEAGNLEEARELQFRANRVIKALLSVPLIAGLKQLLSAQGIPCGAPRRPQRPLTPAERERLRAEVEAAGLEALEADALRRLAVRA
jgi:N-acetylneuraminate lyase